MTRIAIRQYSPEHASALAATGLHPTLARILAARGVARAAELATDLPELVPPAAMKGIGHAATYLADAIAAGKRLLIVADYDCDGATACAVGVRGLRMLGARVEYIVPNRFEYGYGLTPEIVALAAKQNPDVIVTVDNGIASVDGVAAANALGIDVVVTDHHLPGSELPQAAVIVNPNQPGCEFPSKNLAGVGVMFYVLLALRAELRRRGVYTQQTQPPLQTLLDLVALGTVADVVKLDTNNRILVAQGLRRMRAGRMQPGVAALFRAAGREAARANTFDLGFGLGPRLNAAGRLADMSLGIECLLTDDANRAWEIAQELDSMNRERRDIEAGMQQEALQILEQPMAGLAGPDASARYTVSVFNDTWHQGVIGIVASRLKDKFHRPTITFAPGDDTTVKGSGRSIPGFHLRDALDLVSKRHPGMLLKFGGHAMAAGLTVRAERFAEFQEAFEAVGREWLTDDQLARVIETDGDIEDQCFSPEFVTLLEQQVWGQGFPAPTFCGEFDVLRQSVLKGKHLKLQLGRGSQRFDAIWFNHADSLGASAQVAYRLDNNTFNGVTRVQLVIEHAQ
ncbi:ssDNA exonuclease, 5' --_ 3'-specific, Mg-dependent [Cupriavidus taiwanensis]|uniref:Single-stranded-DNA-specific exonuclease RecJ n=1 Tax=Cupriavidus taiwanensis TaxID=164546 RepID=A0A375DZP0_9BURK|nr:single-stranded-DNA-specific exonuclease RecJ [Cupriavidus taiwanensis]SOZ50076.1 ssDNA exonuclease, 5' --> 3'-specific, Mg-dependent [Cupriavidus taiwanensis]SOZ50817.1 ssDNA exonuclease, 5' --> 3'-specific, Mg-dependent [Cupriavidus taiwanensis]SOZ53479.1 ssDNA exonuclease, 5' --> 3'-specific, Mg-dependent [Cupriavidus taiwanensis]SPA04051.1 ssDNA exonuclease, 5' --> 3'-specific, Mg-dependent [Cupriavidus taiwanensis]SPA14504.1 ssDNA exonuclease, 5' --> 3'-specific, Mg-dependent [Cupriavi